MKRTAAILMTALLLFALWCIRPANLPRMAQVRAAGAFVQGNTCFTNVNPITCSLSGTTAGNIIVVAIGYVYAGTEPTATATDTNGSMGLGFGPTKDVSEKIDSYMFVQPNVAGGSDTVTITLSQAYTNIRTAIVEFSGIAKTSPLDGTGAGAVGTGNPQSSGTWTATNGSFIVGWGYNSGGNIFGPASGFSSDASVLNAGITCVEWKTLSGTSASASQAGGGSTTTSVGIALKMPVSFVTSPFPGAFFPGP